jgi:H+-transporting ATPase
MSISGLNSAKVKAQYQKYGPNRIPEKKFSGVIKLLKHIISPINLMLLIAALLSYIDGKIFDCWFIIVLTLLNLGITIFQEHKADNAIAKLNSKLINQIRVLRDDKWLNINEQDLVPDDIIELKVGDQVPADGEIVEAKNVLINEANISGESLPVSKNIGDKAFSGSALTTGKALMKVTATGANTYLGKIIIKSENTEKKSLLEMDILSISRFLILLSLIAIVILNIVLLSKETPIKEMLELDLSLVIAGIPISLPTVMSLIIEIGVIRLAAKKLLTRRISALEDLANVNFILTDKTGTLTKNKITVNNIQSYDGFSESSIINFAALAAKSDPDNPINSAVIEKAKHIDASNETVKILDFIPADSLRKRNTALVEINNKQYLISVGAPQVIIKLCDSNQKQQSEYDMHVKQAALKGERSLAVAVREARDIKDENHMQLYGLLNLSDTLRSNATSIIKFLKLNNINVVMITGDHREIAKHIASELGIESSNVAIREDLTKWDQSSKPKDIFKEFQVFAEILPEDKLTLVNYAKQDNIVAATGDGINDLPALKSANVSIAVNTAVSALKSTSDFVLLTNGIDVIKDAIIESRKIFTRLYNYSVYRMSESFRLIISILILGSILGEYPLTAIQLIILALLNDIPIITLAFDNVKATQTPQKINAKHRMILSLAYGAVGILNSMLLFYIFTYLLKFDLAIVQTIFFLKLTVSGHLLIFVAHTSETWYKNLPSREIIIATFTTQIIATTIALTGFMMPATITITMAIFVWLWAFLWMQVGEITKILVKKWSLKH